MNTNLRNLTIVSGIIMGKMIVITIVKKVFKIKRRKQS